MILLLPILSFVKLPYPSGPLELNYCQHFLKFFLGVELYQKVYSNLLLTTYFGILILGNVSARLLMVRLAQLTLPGPIPDEERKSTEYFIFILLCGASKGFMKALKAFIKPFGPP